MMVDEVAVAGLVRTRAELMACHDERAVNVAVGVALDAFAGGASVTEACREGRRYLECWGRHPSNLQSEVRSTDLSFAIAKAS